MRTRMRSAGGRGRAGVSRTWPRPQRSIVKGRGSGRLPAWIETALWISASETAWLKVSTTSAVGRHPLGPGRGIALQQGGPRGGEGEHEGLGERRAVERARARGDLHAEGGGRRQRRLRVEAQPGAADPVERPRHGRPELDRRRRIGGPEAELTHRTVEEHRDLGVVGRLPSRAGERHAERPRGRGERRRRRRLHRERRPRGQHGRRAAGQARGDEGAGEGERGEGSGHGAWRDPAGAGFQGRRRFFIASRGAPVRRW